MISMQTRHHRLVEVIIIFLAILTLGGYGLFVTKFTPIDLPSSSESEPDPSVTAPGVVKNQKVTARTTVAANTKKRVLQKVPFIPQAPLGDWKDPRQQDGCEETASLMAMLWARGKTMTREQGLKEILAIADYEDATFGNFHDTSAEDTLKRIIIGYFHYPSATVRTNITTNDIRDELYKGNIVLAPADGRKLGNPNFTRPGPETHMLVIIGYDPTIDRFITNDAGTRNGAGYQYTPNAIQRSLLNYPTGHHEPIVTRATAMIVVSK